MGEKSLSSTLKAYEIKTNDPLIYRYWNEPKFAALVDVMAASIIEKKYYTLDMFVDAAIVAVNLAQENRIRRGKPSTE